MIRKLTAVLMVLATLVSTPVAALAPLDVAAAEEGVAAESEPVSTATVSTGPAIAQTGPAIVQSGSAIVYAKVKLKKTKVSLYPDETYRLSVKWGKGKHSELTWTVADKKVARVSKKGNVRALSPGTTKVTVKTAAGSTATATIAVKAPDMSRSVYFTFDDGPSSQVTPQLLSVLRSSGVKATFFIVGFMAKGKEDILRQMVKDGHTLAIHTYSHDYRQIYSSKAAFLADFHKTEKLIKDATGVQPTYFRFPGGGNNSYLSTSLRDQILAELHKEGYTAMDWNAGTSDASGLYYSKETLINKGKTSHWGSGPIILLQHDTNAKYHTPAVTKALIDYYRSKGYTFANLDHYYGAELCFRKR